jgi:tRNA A64-2'-O-ribosylphosphate transferase
VDGGEADGYVQGAGDDAETWAMGLTPAVFWANAEDLLAADEVDLPRLVESILAKASDMSSQTANERHQVAPRISVTSLPLPITPDTSHECQVLLLPTISPPEAWIKTASRMEAGLGKHRSAARNLRTALPAICGFVSHHLKTQAGASVLIACESGRDISVAVALALLCRLFDEDGSFRPLNEDITFNKEAIRIKLGSIMVAFPDANPHRAALQSVNSFLMDWRK